MFCFVLLGFSFSSTPQAIAIEQKKLFTSEYDSYSSKFWGIPKKELKGTEFINNMRQNSSGRPE